MQLQKYISSARRTFRWTHTQADPDTKGRTSSTKHYQEATNPGKHTSNRHTHVRPDKIPGEHTSKRTQLAHHWLREYNISNTDVFLAKRC